MIRTLYSAARLSPFAFCIAATLIIALIAANDPAIAATPDTSTQASAKESLRHGIRESIAHYEQQVARSDPELTIRETTNVAYYLLAMGAAPTRAEEAIRKAFASQIMDRASKDYGSFPWDFQTSQIADPNGVEFTLSSLGPILLRYGDKLSPAFKQEAIEHVRAGLIAVHRHKVPVSYTNIYLMKIENLLLLGEWLSDQPSIDEAQKMLEAWLAECRQVGVHEYASPTYSAVQLGCLCQAYRNTGIQLAKPALKAAIDLLWSDLAANYSPVSETLGGAHSRDYDFITGMGSINWFYYVAGLRPDAPAEADFSTGLDLFMNMQEGGYRLSADGNAAAAMPRRLCERWGDRPGQDRYTYITSDFSAGSTSAWYGPQDRQVAVQLPSSPGQPAPQPIIAIVPDAFDSPYGKVHQADRSGHMKPTHLRDSIAAVQDDGLILALLDLSPGISSEPVRSIATNVVLPLHVDELVLDQHRVEIPGDVSNWSMAAATSSVVGIRQGRAAVAIRIFAADALADQSPLLQLKADGAEWGAGRLVAYHYIGGPRAFDGAARPIRAGVLIVTVPCNDESEFNSLLARVAAARLTEHRSAAGGADQWDVTATVGDQALEAALDFKTGLPTVRRVNGAEFVAPDIK